MSRFLLPFLGILTAALLSAAFPGLARADLEEDERLATQLVTAAEKYAELQEVAVKHGRRAELALTVLQMEQQRAALSAQLRDMNTVIAGFPQNRRWWINDQAAFFQRKLAGDMQLNALDRQLHALRFQERQMYEEGLRQAQATGRRVKPFHREAILQDFQRLNRESREATAELKAGVEAAAQKQQTTRGEILRRARDRVGKETSTLPAEALEKFLRDFNKYAGGGWLEAGSTKPPGDTNQEDEKKRPRKADNENRARTWLRMGDNLKDTNPNAARKRYEDIIRTYPDTKAAQIARSRLKNSKSR